jgi:hypothetical protein
LGNADDEEEELKEPEEIANNNEQESVEEIIHVGLSPNYNQQNEANLNEHLWGEPNFPIGLFAEPVGININNNQLPRMAMRPSRQHLVPNEVKPNLERVFNIPNRPVRRTAPVNENYGSSDESELDEGQVAVEEDGSGEEFEDPESES